MPWFAQAVDKADGTLSPKRQFWFFGTHRLHLSWDIKESEASIIAVVNMHKKLAAATGSTALVPAGWLLSKGLITPHPARRLQHG